MRGEKRIDFQNQRNIHVLVLGAVLVDGFYSGLKGRRSGGEWFQGLLTRSSSYIIMILRQAPYQYLCCIRQTYKMEIWISIQNWV